MVVRFNKKVIPNIVESAKDSIADSNNLVYEEVLRLVLDTPKTGKIYVNRATGGPHQASAPFEPFANETGNALKKTKTYEENNGLKGRIAGEAEYAMALELGRGGVAERPVFRPALANKSKEIVKVFKENLLKAIKKS